MNDVVKTLNKKINSCIFFFKNPFTLHLKYIKFCEVTLVHPCVRWCFALKGRCPKIFRIGFFSWIIFPQASENLAISVFLRKIFGNFLTQKFYTFLKSTQNSASFDTLWSVRWRRVTNYLVYYWPLPAIPRYKFSSRMNFFLQSAEKSLAEVSTLQPELVFVVVLRGEKSIPGID